LLPLEEKHHIAKICEISIQIYKKLVAIELGHDVTFDEFFLLSHLENHFKELLFLFKSFQKLEIELKEKIIH
jgi:hypothetical protein